jgi:hypothetical protein
MVPESYIRLESKLMDLVSSGVDYIEWEYYVQVAQGCRIYLIFLNFFNFFFSFFSVFFSPG